MKAQRITPALRDRLEKRAWMLYHLAKPKTITSIAKTRKTSPQSIYAYLKRLRENGYITRERELTHKGYKLVENWLVVSKDVDKPPVKIPPNSDRLHDVQFRIGILKKKSNWNETRITLPRIKIKNYSEWNVKGWIENQFFIGNCCIRTTPDAVLVRLEQDLYGSPQECVDAAVKILHSVIPRIEALFGVELSRDLFVNITLGRQHHAIVKNDIARWFLKRGVKLRIKGPDGGVRWVVDNSAGLEELEAVHKVFAEQDAERMKAFISDVTFNDPPVLSELAASVAAVKASQKELAVSLKAFMDEAGKVFGEQSKLNFVFSENLKAVEASHREIVEILRRDK